MDFKKQCEESLLLINSLFELLYESRLRGPIIEATYKFLANLEDLLLMVKSEIHPQQNSLLNTRAKYLELMHSHIFEIKNIFTSSSKSLVPEEPIHLQIEKIEGIIKELKLSVFYLVSEQDVDSFSQLLKLSHKLYEFNNESDLDMSFKREFISREAANVWIKYIGIVHHQSWSKALQAFSDYLNNVDNYSSMKLSENSCRFLRECLDQEHEQTVRIQDWDIFFLRFWSVGAQREKLLSGTNKFKYPDFKMRMKLALAIVDSECSQYLPKIGNLYHLSNDGIVYKDYLEKKVTVEKNLYENSLLVGRVTNETRPDVYFESKCSSIGRKQFELFAKLTDNQEENGFFIKCISATNPTCFLVKEDGFLVNNQMMIWLAQVFYIRIDEVFPVPARNEKQPGLIYLDTSDIFSSKNNYSSVRHL